VCPRGSGSDAELGAPPARYDLALDLTALDQVLEWNPDDLTATVQAGTRLGALNARLGPKGQRLPVDPPGGATRTIGGVIATNASGSLRARYGTLRDLLLGVRFVQADGVMTWGGAAGVAACTVRLSGLYGPGRTGILERVRAGRLALGAGEEVWMNFCHLADAAAFVLAALARGAPGAVYHGSDAAPARRREVVGWIAERLGVAPARLDASPPGPDRRIRSEWTREVLGVSLAFPSFREGLAAHLAGSPAHLTPPSPRSAGRG
jgi:hypothetical protein